MYVKQSTTRRSDNSHRQASTLWRGLLRFTNETCCFKSWVSPWPPQPENGSPTVLSARLNILMPLFQSRSITSPQPQLWTLSLRSFSTLSPQDEHSMLVPLGSIPTVCLPRFTATACNIVKKLPHAASKIDLASRVRAKPLILKFSNPIKS